MQDLPSTSACWPRLRVRVAFSQSQYAYRPFRPLLPKYTINCSVIFVCFPYYLTFRSYNIAYIVVVVIVAMQVRSTLDPIIGVLLEYTEVKGHYSPTLLFLIEKNIRISSHVKSYKISSTKRARSRDTLAARHQVLKKKLNLKVGHY